jgi:hypothetical protein
MGEIERPRPMTQYFSYLVTMRSRDQELLTCRAWSSDFNVGIGGLPLPARIIILRRRMATYCATEASLILQDELDSIQSL